MTGIYIITSPTNKVYIGQSWALEQRLEQYKKLDCLKQRKIYASLKKHGVNTHKFEVILELREDISQTDLDTWEEYFYELYRANHELLNIRFPGSRGRHSEETRQLFSKINKIRFSKPENNVFFGKKHSEESRRKMSLSHKGTTHSAAQKAAHTPKYSYNHYKSKTTLRLSLDGEVIDEWGSMGYAAKSLNLQVAHIHSCCIGARKTHGGFKWKYK